MRGFVLIAAWLCLGTSEGAHAANDLRSFYFGARSKGMGGAYLGVTDDEQAVFLNPAGIAGSDGGSLHYLPVAAEASGDTYLAYAESATLFRSFSLDSLNALMGRNIYARAQATPMLILPGFALSIISDAQVALFQKNQAYPQTTFATQVTNGAQATLGFSLYKGRAKRQLNKKKKWRQGKPVTDLRVGASLKVAWRRGGYYDLNSLDLLLMASQGQEGLKQLLGGFHLGIGGDVGIHLDQPLMDGLTLGVGAAFLDVGDTAYGTASPQRGDLGVGAAVKYDSTAFDVTLAYDFRNILSDVDWAAKNHFGLEIGLPVVDLLLGFHHGSVTYGVGVNVWVAKISAVSYAQELGTYVGQDPNRRFALRVDMSLRL